MGPLEDLFQTRTMANRKGTVLHDALLRADLERLIEQNAVEGVTCPSYVLEDSRERTCYRDTITGEVYVYVEGWERGAPQFHKIETNQ